MVDDSANDIQPAVQDPLALRVTECPGCKRKHLIAVDDLQRHARCVCEMRFHLAQHVVTDDITDMESCYSTWACPQCRKKLLVPQFAVVLPAVCPCGQEYPTASQAGLAMRYVLDEVTNAFIGNDPLLSENMLVPLRAAQRYDYDVTHVGNEVYSVRNPKKGTTYTVELSVDHADECNCDVFQAGAGTCIHIEHVRIKLGLPSTAMVMADSEEFAYAWMDKVNASSENPHWMVRKRRASSAISGSTTWSNYDKSET